MAQTLLGVVVFIVLVGLGLVGLQAGGSVPQAVILLLSAAVGFAVWRSQENAKHAQDLEAKLVTDKAFLYKVYLDVLREIFDKAGSGTDDRTMAPILKKLNAFVWGSLLIASDEVVLAHDRFMGASKIAPDMVMPAMADLVLAMRRDAGEASTRLRTIDVLATFIKADDIEQFRPHCERWEREKTSAWAGPKATPTKP
jgi:hypothetical protein